MARKLGPFISEFVVPLHTGGPLVLGTPMGLTDVDRMMGEGGELMSDELRLARERAAQLWLAEAHPDDPGRADLLVWAAIHNILVLDHPDRERVWTRTSTWELLRKTTSSMLYQAAPVDMAGQLSLHLSIAAMFRMTRADEVVRVGDQTRRFPGRPAPRSARRLASVGEVELSAETVDWIDRPHHASAEWLIADAMRISPLTSLLWPERSARDYDPRSAARWLRSAAGARAVVYEWARSEDWVGTGAALTERLARALGHEFERNPDRPSEPDDVDASENHEAEPALLALAGASHHTPAELASLLGAMIHLHFIKVLGLESRVGLGGRRQRAAARAFLALPLLLPQLRDTLGDPLVGVEDSELLRRWDDYLEHLRGLVPRDTVENLLAVFVEPVVQGDSE